jgi:hypothetical protein
MTVAIIGLSFIVIPFAWGQLAHFLMPTVVFEIGDGINRSERLRGRRTQVLWVVIIGAIMAPTIELLVNYLYDRIK